MPASRRDHLVETALRLFSSGGFHATGIDRILAEAGVAKKTLYHHFRSKDELIVAALEKRDGEFMAKMRTAVARLAPRQTGDPRMAPLLAFFEGLQEWFDSDSFCGCAFINASAEYPRADSPVHGACRAHKRKVLDNLGEMASGMGLENRELVAREVALLADGAIVSAHTRSDPGAGLAAREAARRLLQAHLAAGG